MSCSALVLSGCMVGPDWTKPKAPVAPQWLEARDRSVVTRRQEYVEWWTVFNDPTLNRLVQTAFEQNLTLRIAGVRVLEARAQLGLAVGEFYPQQQQAVGELNYNKDPTSSLDLLPRYWKASLGAQITWELDFWGKFRRAIQSADAAFLGSVATYDDVLVTLIGDVATAYVGIRTIEREIAIAYDNIRKQKDALAIAQARFKGGAVSERDVYQAKNVLYATEASIPKLNLQLQQARNALSVLLGLPPQRLDTLLKGRRPIPTAPKEVIVGIPADLLRRRPDVRAAELSAAAQSAQIGFAKADLFPSFALLGTIGTSATTLGNASLGNLFTNNSMAYSVGPSFQWNILNYGQITNNVRIQDARLQALLLNYQNTVLKAQKEVEDGLAQVLQSRAQAELLRKSVAAANGALRIAMTQYQGGIADFTTVLLAEQNLYEAQINLTEATGDVATGLIAVYRGLGGGWQIREGHDFVPPATRETMANRTDWGPGGPESVLLRPGAPGLPSSKKVNKVSVPPPDW
ncbi:MAG: efflux transporter outer membrane subunit [Parvibaculaceae bacterium]